MNSIDDLDFSKTYTYADYLMWRFEERLELIKGKIFKMISIVGTNHDAVLSNIANELNHCLKNKSSQVFVAPLEIRLNCDENNTKQNETVVQPDICVICDSDKLIDKRGCLGAPDLVIEVLSQGNNSKDLRVKYDLYEEFGVKEYWVVYPLARTLIRYVLNNGKFTSEGRALTVGDKVTTPVLPGFELALDDVFRNLI